jgi:hypothetical protein
MNGVEFLRELRHRPRHAATPIVIATSETDDSPPLRMASSTFYAFSAFYALNVVEFLPAEEQNVDRSCYLPRTRQPPRAPDRVHGEPARPCTTGCRIRYQDLILPGTEPNHLAIQRSPITFQLSVHPVPPENHERAEG